MSKTANKTTQNNTSPADFIASIEHRTRREDANNLLTWFEEVTDLQAVMWGSSIIGYGRYYYKYESGREGESMLTGFSPRKSALSLYIMPGYRDLNDKLQRLGKHKTGKSCLTINKLTDVDMDVLCEIVVDGVAYMRKNYKTWDI